MIRLTRPGRERKFEWNRWNNSIIRIRTGSSLGQLVISLRVELTSSDTVLPAEFDASFHSLEHSQWHRQASTPYLTGIAAVRHTRRRLWPSAIILWRLRSYPLSSVRVDEVLTLAQTFGKTLCFTKVENVGMSRQLWEDFVFFLNLHGSLAIRSIILEVLQLQNFARIVKDE